MKIAKSFVSKDKKLKTLIRLPNNILSYWSTVAQMAEWAPQDWKVPSSNPALDPMWPHFKEYSTQQNPLPTNQHTYSCYPFTVIIKVNNSGYSHISVPAQELHSRAAPSVGGSITAQLVQPQEEIPEEGKKKHFILLLELGQAV